MCWSGGIQALGDAAKALREGPDVGLAAALCPESHAGLQASKWRPLPPGQPDGHGSGHFWLWQCVGIRVGGPASSRSWNNPASASSPVRAGLKMATRFSVASPMRHGTLCSRAQAVGSWAQPVLEWNYRRCWSGPWHQSPTCFVSGISWQAGHVAVCARPEWGPEGSPWTCSPYSCRPPHLHFGHAGL